ncbi:hypothetical protein PMAYCL1PPCAC_22509, partial [Pristionchus mayeri]
EENFAINDTKTATISTSSSLANCLALLMIWILGDVIERRKLLIVSMFSWIVFCFLSIFLGSNNFVVFVAFRSLAGAAAALFGVAIPVLTADI